MSLLACFTDLGILQSPWSCPIRWNARLQSEMDLQNMNVAATSTHISNPSGSSMGAFDRARPQKSRSGSIVDSTEGSVSMFSFDSASASFVHVMSC